MDELPNMGIILNKTKITHISFKSKINVKQIIITRFVGIIGSPKTKVRYLLLSHSIELNCTACLQTNVVIATGFQK